MPARLVVTVVRGPTSRWGVQYQARVPSLAWKEERGCLTDSRGSAPEVAEGHSLRVAAVELTKGAGEMSELTETLEMVDALSTSSAVEPSGVNLETAPAPSWEAMVDRHYMFVYRRCLMLARNTQDAEDLTQETFVNVFRSWTTYQPGNVEGWLNRIATNLFINLVRRRNRATLYPLSDTDTPLPTQARPDAIELVTDQILDPDVVAALEAVTPLFRTVVLLNDVAGVPRAQIAQLLGLNPSTVGTRLFRGREQLRRSLAHRRPAARASHRTDRPQR